MSRGRKPYAESLTEAVILAWADAHFARTGEWPTSASGAIPGAPTNVWRAVNQALTRGNRGLPGGSSLARLLAECRGKRNRSWQPHLSVEQILSWADKHHEQTGRWPNQYAGPVAGAPGETWKHINDCLRRGFRGLPGRHSLARLLESRRGVRRWAQKG
jgi:hypothetical protein